MTGVVRVGDVCSGHGPWPPRPSTGGSSDCFVNGLPVVRVGDPWAAHTEVVKPYETHSSVTASGAPDCFVNGKAVCIVGSSIACGSVAASGSTDCFVNGG